MALNLLPYHKAILSDIHDPATSEFVLVARGLGLRKIVCTLLQIYDSKENLVLLVNASQDEELAFGEELGIMGCRDPGLRIVGYEMNRKERQNLYKGGGLLAVTSRILVVDLLQSDIPIDLITGIIVLHAEKISALCLEAFIVRLYREKNQTGFLKAFSDQPEHITSGLSPLRNIMKELQLRKVHIFPRFHQDVKESLERRRADVVELHQPMTEAMSDIHGAIIQCITATLNELKRSNATLDLDDFNVENAYFSSFDAIVRRQLDPVWHKVGPRTKQLVSDLATLRRLLNYLLTYDALAFHAYLETIITSNTTNEAGNARQHQSPWLLTDAANLIFLTAKRRCYILTKPSAELAAASAIEVELDEGWAALDEIEGNQRRPGAKRKWLPDGMEPVLEELPKWGLVAEVLQEIEEEMIRQESLPQAFSSLGTNTVLIMTSSTRTSEVLSEYLSTMDTSLPNGARGRRMMERRLKLYLWWKGKLSEREKKGERPFSMPQPKDGEIGELSEALKRKDAERNARAASRRRVRGGAPAGGSTDRPKEKREPALQAEAGLRDEADTVAKFLSSQKPTTAGGPSTSNADDFFADVNDADEQLALALAGDIDLTILDFDDDYGLIPPEQTVLVRAYSDDSDDQLLAEIQPRFIIMLDPNQDFIRRIEVYRSSSPGLGVRVYFMVYQNSSEEHKYLAGLRREKDAFERLIKERGSMLMPILEQRRAGTETGETLIKTISSRLAGGRRDISTTPSQVIVDMRDFRSSLPSLLHAANLLVIPATLTVGDYILTPDICVERKSIPDLISSFNSGRLYTQCELMSVHYKHPMLLIEFEENKSFSLEVATDIKSYVKPTGKYPPKAGNADKPAAAPPAIQSKLVLLTLSFPRLRIIWSSSPFATAEIFKDLKANAPEPDPARAIAIGAEEDPEAGAGVNHAAEELLRSLPGVNAKNVKYVMSRVGSVRELCEMDLAHVQDILGAEPGKACYEFMHRGEPRMQ